MLPYPLQVFKLTESNSRWSFRYQPIGALGGEGKVRSTVIDIGYGSFGGIFTKDTVPEKLKEYEALAKERILRALIVEVEDSKCRGKHLINALLWRESLMWPQK
jgi:hypothetical protein